MGRCERSDCQSGAWSIHLTSELSVASFDVEKLDIRIGCPDCRLFGGDNSEPKTSFSPFLDDFAAKRG